MLNMETLRSLSQPFQHGDGHSCGKRGLLTLGLYVSSIALPDLGFF